MPRGKAARVTSQPTPEPAPPLESAPAKPLRKPRTPRPQAPPPPSPVILALQEQILAIVSRREGVQKDIRDLAFDADDAQRRLKLAYDLLASLESEVQYRLSLIAQLSGQPEIRYPVSMPALQRGIGYPEPGPERVYMPPNSIMTGAVQPLIQPRMEGISSIPAPAPARPQLVPADGVNQGSAEEFRGI